jgi:hypothetical protein
MHISFDLFISICCINMNVEFDTWKLCRIPLMWTGKINRCVIKHMYRLICFSFICSSDIWTT